MYMGENTPTEQEWIPYLPCWECGGTEFIEHADHTWIIEGGSEVPNERTMLRGETITKSIVCRNCDRILSST